MSKKWIDVMVVLLLFAGIFIFLFATGTIQSGYHFIDDHEMLAINSDLKSSSFIDVSIKWIAQDLMIRFRPVYFLHRVLEMQVLGANFFALSFYHGLLAAITFSLFYHGFKKMNFSVLESLGLVLLTFIGPQMAIWWKLGPNETIGMAFLGASFFFMARCLSRKYYFTDNIFFNLFLVLASLSKESFVIIIPAFVLFKIWSESQVFKISIKHSIGNNILAAFSLAVMAAEIFVIVFVIGTNKIGYAGSTSGLGETLRGIGIILTNPSMLAGWVVLVAFVALLFFLPPILLKQKNRGLFKQLFKSVVPVLTFAVLVVAPNVVLSAKSGMLERYLLPATLGLAFLTITLLKKTNFRLVRWATAVGCIGFIVLSMVSSVKAANGFASEGRQTNQLLSAIVTNADVDSEIFLVADPVDWWYEVSISLHIYLTDKRLSDLYVYPVERENKTDFEKDLARIWKEKFKDRILVNIRGNPDLIVFIDKTQDVNFFSSSVLQRSDYEDILSGNNLFALFVKKTSSEAPQTPQ